MKKQTLLKDFFGHNSFKPQQEAAIDAILEARDVLMILPTGGGKSLAYQLPSLMMEGTTIVISPLIALMQDQVQNLRNQNIKAAMLASNQSLSENDTIIKSLLNGEFKLLYISPERLNSAKMQEVLKRVQINFFVIDEAHCISEWGHEFRDDYRALSILKQLYPQKAIAAFTATATLSVQKDILNLLHLQNPLILKGNIFRSNLIIDIRQRIKYGYEALLEFLEDKKDVRGIIYMPSRAKCEELSKYLCSRGFNADFYHAGMESQSRDAVFHRFVHDEINIVVATIAFGMGIDKSDIRFVVHMSMPKTIENYFQEIGRAGRDGEMSQVLMLYSSQDLIYAKMRIEELENESYKRNLLEKLTTVYRFVSTQECRHQYIAHYFEDEIAPCVDRCDNCLCGEITQKEISEDSKKLLSTIYRVNQKFGKNHIIDVLKGAENKKILDNEHNKLSVYGIGKNVHKKQWLVIVDRLLEIEALKFGAFQVLLLTPLGIDILKGLQTVSINSERLVLHKKFAKEKLVASDFDLELFQNLRELRSKIAQDLNVPAYMVFGDKTLKELSRLKPSTKEKMLEVNGVGQKKMEQFGEAFLNAIVPIKNH